MKKYILLANLLLICIFAKAQVTGTAFLEGQTDHSGIKVKFIANSPTAKTDSTTTNSNGSYSIVLQGGVYKVEFSKTGYQKIAYNNNTALTISATQSLNIVTLPSGNFVDVSGTVSGIWTKGTTYIVKGDLLVPTGQTLTIQPGVIVRFDGEYTLSISGTLLAIGSENDTILFTSNKTNPSENDWKGIYFNNTTTGSQIGYCNIGYFKEGIILDNGSKGFNIFLNYLHDFKYYGILDYGGSNTITGNVIMNYSINSQVLSPAISVYTDSSIVSCNKISNGNSTGIFVYCKCIIENNKITNINSVDEINGAIRIISFDPIVRNNYISESKVGISVISAASPNPYILNNTIINCKHGIGYSYNAKGIIKNNIISNNEIGIFVDDPGLSQYFGPNEISYNIFYNTYQNFYNTRITGLETIVSINSKEYEIDAYYNLYQDPKLRIKSPILANNSPAIGSGENGTTIGVDPSLFCFSIDPCDYVVTISPEITVYSGNLIVLNTMVGSNYQWYLNNYEETGQTSSIHTNPLVNGEYKVRSSINDCPSTTSEPVSIFRSISLTTVTVTKVVTVTTCDLPGASMRKEAVNVSANFDDTNNSIRISGPVAYALVKSADDKLIKRVKGSFIPLVKELSKEMIFLEAFNAKGELLKKFSIASP